MKIAVALLFVSVFSLPVYAGSVVFDSGESDHIGGLNITDWQVAIPIETTNTVSADFFRFWDQFPTIYVLDLCAGPKSDRFVVHLRITVSCDNAIESPLPRFSDNLSGREWRITNCGLQRISE
jgi:hypothetical protein